VGRQHAGRRDALAGPRRGEAPRRRDGAQRRDLARPAGNYLSPTANVTERFTKIDNDHIQYSATIEDPEVYTKPWTISMVLYRHVEPNAQLLEFRCVPFSEQLLYGDLLEENASPAEGSTPSK
jgi:hypothetical protein